MKVKELLKLLLECSKDDEVFSSGLNKFYKARSICVVTRVENLNRHVVIVSG